MQTTALRTLCTALLLTTGAPLWAQNAPGPAPLGNVLTTNENIVIVFQMLKASKLINLTSDTPELRQLSDELSGLMGHSGGRARRDTGLTQDNALKALVAICSQGYALNLAASGKPRSEWAALPTAFRAALAKALAGKTLSESDMKETETQLKTLLPLLQSATGQSQGGTRRSPQSQGDARSRKGGKNNDSGDKGSSSGGDIKGNGSGDDSGTIKPSGGSSAPGGQVAPGLKTAIAGSVQSSAAIADKIAK